MVHKVKIKIFEKEALALLAPPGSYVTKFEPHSSPFVNSNSKWVVNIVSYVMIN